jgi:chromosome segregation ATPase
MKSSALIGLMTLSLLLSCSPGEFEKTRGELKTCEERRASIVQEADSCRQESARQKQRWEAIQAELDKAVPTPIQDARVKVLEGLPQEVRVESQLQLDSYFMAVARNFKQVQDRNQEILQELKQARREVTKTSGQVERVAKSTSNLEEGLAAVQKGNEEAQKVNEEVRQLHEQLQAHQQQTTAEIQKVIASVIEFDRNRLNCRECRERLRMMDKNRMEILKFHADLIQKLTTMQSSAEGSAP